MRGACCVRGAANNSQYVGQSITSSWLRACTVWIWMADVHFFSSYFYCTEQGRRYAPTGFVIWMDVTTACGSNAPAHRSCHFSCVCWKRVAAIARDFLMHAGPARLPRQSGPSDGQAINKMNNHRNLLWIKMVNIFADNFAQNILFSSKCRILLLRRLRLLQRHHVRFHFETIVTHLAVSVSLIHDFFLFKGKLHWKFSQSVFQVYFICDSTSTSIAPKRKRMRRRKKEKLQQKKTHSLDTTQSMHGS